MVNYKKQNFLSLDLEFNQPSGSIIEVGVAIGNVTQGILETRSWYVNPYEDISEYITNLTGITQANVENEFTEMEEIAEELSSLIRTYSCFVNPIQWGHGDSQELLREFHICGISFPHFGRREIDVKTICVFHRMRKDMGFKGGLKKFVNAYGLEFRGEAHRAAVDAENTLRLWFELLKKENL